MKKLKIAIIVAFIGLAMLTSCDSNNNSGNTDINIPDKDITSISVDGLKKEYGMGSTIDLTDLSVIVKYSDASEKAFSLFDDNVSYDLFTTDTLGEHIVRVTYNGISVDVSYKVCEFNLTLDFNGGKYNDLEFMTLDAKKNIASVKGIIPNREDGYKFAGWFYDKELTKRVEFRIADEFFISSNTTLYAGYDVDYTNIFDYELVDNEVVLKAWLDNTSNVIYIPRTIDLYPVCKIADNFAYQDDPWGDMHDLRDFNEAFLNKTLVFEDNSNIKYIGKNAFNSVTLNNFSLPDSIEMIDDYAFYFTGITSLVLPKNIKSIGAYSFGFNFSLKTVDFNDSELISIGNGAFADCMDLNQVNLSNKIEIIGSNAFSNCTNFIEFDIPASVETIGINVFSGFPNLKSINVDNNNKKFKSIDGNLYSKDGKIFYRYCYGNALKRFVMPEEVEIIFEGAFNIINENAYLEELILNEGLVEIGDLAFENTSIDFTLPSTIKTVGQKAFYGWNGKEFKVDSNNLSFKAINKSLVSYDGSILYAIAGGFDDDSYILDDNVELISSYACSSLNIISFVIGSNSKLKKINSKAFEFCQFKYLSYIYILIDEPFTLEDDSIYSSSEFRLNDNFYIIASNIERYQNAWADIMLYGTDSLVDIYLKTPSEYIDNVINHMDDKLNISSFDGFINFNKFLFKFDYNADFYNILAILNKDISVLNLDINIDEEKYNYIKEFIINAVKSLIDYFNVDDVKVLVSANISYSKFYDSYLMIPENILNEIDITYRDNALKLANKYEEIISNSKEIMNDINNFSYSSDSFDVDSYNDIIKRINRYNFNNLPRTTNQDLALYKLELQNLLYLFNSLDYSIENYSNLYKIYYGSYFIADNYSMGIKFYLDIYFADSNDCVGLFGFKELEDNLIKLDSLKASIVNETNDEFSSFVEGEEFDLNNYTDLFYKYEIIENKYLFDYDTVIKYNFFKLRCYNNELLNKSINPKTNKLYTLDEYTDAVLVELAIIGDKRNEVLNNLMKNLDVESIDNYLSNLSETQAVILAIDNYNLKFAELTNYDDELDTINPTISFIGSSLDNYSKYLNFFKVISFDRYYEAYYIAYNINTLLNTQLSEENYEQIFNLIVGKINVFLDKYAYDSVVMEIIDALLNDGSYDNYLLLNSML